MVMFMFMLVYVFLQNVSVLAFTKYMKVHTATTKLDGEGNLYEIDRVVLHEKYDETEFLENDIALIKVLYIKYYATVTQS